MPGVLPVGIGQLIASPPIALLDPVLDENGPYGAGDHTITDFVITVPHGILLPGTHPIGGTFGVIIQPTVIPLTWGYEIGYDSTGPIGAEGYVYENRFAQLVVMHGTISGGYVTILTANCHSLQTYVQTPFVALGADRFGLHVSPGISVDLFFMCLLA